MPDNRTIADLRRGETAYINRILDNDLALKLLEMGCLPGEAVTLLHVAPLGDPMCVRVSGYNLSLRRQEAALVELQAETSLPEEVVSRESLVVSENEKTVI